MTILQALRPRARFAVMPAHHKGRATPSERLAKSPCGSRLAAAGVRQRRLPMSRIAYATLPARRLRDAIIRIILP